jgi:hypothetical protein
MKNDRDGEWRDRVDAQLLTQEMLLISLIVTVPPTSREALAKALEDHALRTKSPRLREKRFRELFQRELRTAIGRLRGSITEGESDAKGT